MLACFNMPCYKLYFSYICVTAYGVSFSKSLIQYTAYLMHFLHDGHLLVFSYPNNDMKFKSIQKPNACDQPRGNDTLGYRESVLYDKYLRRYVYITGHVWDTPVSPARIPGCPTSSPGFSLILTFFNVKSNSYT